MKSTTTAAFTHSEIDQLLTAASRAPSGGNIQPWLVEIEKNILQISLNPQKLGTVLDVNNYGSIFALGSFAKNLEITATHIGLHLERTITNQDNHDLFQIKYLLTSKHQTSPQTLYPSIFKRCTNRHLGLGKLISDAIMDNLSKLTTDLDPSFTLTSVSSNQDKSLVAKVLGIADRIRTKNITLLEQMMSEMRWSAKQAEQTRDGLDVKTMELPGNVSKMLQLLASHPNLAKTVPDIALEKQAWPLLTNSSHLCVVGTDQTINPLLIFNAGYVIQTLWLECASLNLAFHPWTVQSFFAIRAKHFPGSFFNAQEEASLIKANNDLKKIMQLPDGSTPIFIFRLSHANEPSTVSFRHPWQDFTTIN